MGKADRASFTDYRDIEINLNQILNNIDIKLIDRSVSKFLYAEALAEMYYLLLEIHPFREGNGRTVREFLRQYVKDRNKNIEDVDYELDFTLKKEDKELFEIATKSDTRGALVLLFNKMLKDKNKENNLNKFKI